MPLQHFQARISLKLVLICVLIASFNSPQAFAQPQPTVSDTASVATAPQPPLDITLSAQPARNNRAELTIAITSTTDLADVTLNTKLPASIQVVSSTIPAKAMLQRNRQQQYKLTVAGDVNKPQRVRISAKATSRAGKYDVSASLLLISRNNMLEAVSETYKPRTKAVMLPLRTTVKPATSNQSSTMSADTQRIRGRITFTDHGNSYRRRSSALD